MGRLVTPIACIAVVAAMLASRIHMVLGAVLILAVLSPLYVGALYRTLRDPIPAFGFLFPQLLLFMMVTGLEYRQYANLMILGLFAWTMGRVFMGDWKVQRPPLRYTLWIACFTAWAFVAAIASPQADWSLWVAAHYLFMILTLVAVYQFLDTEAKVLRFFDWLIRGSAFYSIIVFSLLFHQGREFGLAQLMMLKGDIYGVGTNAVPIPAIVCFPCALARFLGGGKGRQWYGAATILFLGLIGLSLSRSAWLGAAVAGSACVIIYEIVSGRFVRLLQIGAVLGLASAVAVAWNWETISAVVGLERGTTGRIYLWRAALQMIADHPFTGIGPGMWSMMDAVYADYEGPIDLTHFLPSAHNTFLMQAAEMGIPAGVGVLVFVSMLSWDSLRGALDRRAPVSAPYRIHLLGCFGLVTIITVRGLFESSLVVWPGGASATAWLIFVVVSVARMARPAHSREGAGAPIAR